MVNGILQGFGRTEKRDDMGVRDGIIKFVAKWLYRAIVATAIYVIIRELLSLIQC